MQKFLRLSAAFAFAATFVSTAVRADDWPQWRGPNRDDISRETGLLKEWPKGGPEVVWKAQGLGRGYSSVSVAAGRIYTAGDDDDGSYIRCLDTNGKHVWRAALGKQGDPGGYKGTRATPTVDGDRVFMLGQFGALVCVDAKGGKEIWRKDLKGDFKGQVGGWGYSESPLVDGERLIVSPGGKAGTVAAFNKKTGELIWRTTAFGDSAEYVSPILTEICGVQQYVQLTQQSLVGISRDKGDVLWRAARRGATAVIPTPVVADDQVFVTSGYGVGCNAFKVTKSPGGFSAEEVYSNKNVVNHHGGVVLHNGYVYGHSDSKGWVCLDFKTGDVKWSNGSVGKGSVTMADGHLYLRSEGGKGSLALVEATPDGYKEKGRFDQPDRSGKEAWPHPVISNGRLYIRDQQTLLCFDVKAK
jgi:outer membrane protein assembly factor BamB